jgi:hypothetical protein
LFYWLPIVDAYQTICIASSLEARAVFQNIRNFGAVAWIAEVSNPLLAQASQRRVISSGDEPL